MIDSAALDTAFNLLKWGGLLNPNMRLPRQYLAFSERINRESLRHLNDRSHMRKPNLGCGFDKREGFLNADNFSECNPDLLLDIETTPWPLEDSSFEFILMKHVLEHVGADFKKFTQVFQELYRVLSPEGVLEIHVPHFRHDTWWSDPTHVRAFTPLTFKMMSKKQNDQWIASKSNYTMLAYAMDVDFEMIEAVQVYDPVWWRKVENGELNQSQLRILADQQWGVVKELQIKLKAIK